ncbi:MAG: hypothetical protein HRT63_11005 [Erythrobacter sp.]|nr:hypothetical protein [Erythrobacter sp.]
MKRDNVFDVELIDCRGFDSVAQITDEICCKVNQQNRLRSNAASLEDITPDNWVHGGRKVLFVVEGCGELIESLSDRANEHFIATLEDFSLPWVEEFEDDPVIVHDGIALVFPGQVQSVFALFVSSG